MRVVHVDAERGFSGGEVQVFLLMEGLRQRGVENVLVCPPGSRSEKEARARGFECRAVPMRNDADLPAVIRLSRLLRALAPDLVHLHSGRAAWLSGLAARWGGWCALATRRMDRRVERGWRTRLLYRHLVRRVVAISNSVADSLRAGGVPAERIALIHSAIDPSRIAPAAGGERARRELGAAAQDLVLLVLGRLVRRKGVDVLLDALAALAREGLWPMLWVAGDGPERQALEEKAVRLGLAPRVRFLGRRSDVGDLLTACDVFVAPSRREGLGVAALEAMAAGRPVVAGAVGGLREAVVAERTGILVPPDDAPALALALRRLLCDEALRGRLGGAGPARIAEAYSAEQMVSAYARLYEEILDGR